VVSEIGKSGRNAKPAADSERDSGGGVKRIVARLLYAEVPHAAVYLYAGSLILLYIFVSVHTPLNIRADGPHDDGLFISLGLYLSEGQWLGPFDQFTLMKGPGYPAFLAVNYWLGIPITLGHALLHCAAVVFFVVVSHRFIRSTLLSGLLFTLLLWHPVSLSVPLLRVLRDRIYFDELLILLGALALTLLNGIDRRTRFLVAAFGGGVLGWFWLTREEGVWTLPALSVMMLAAAVRALRTHQLRDLAVAMLIIFGVFATTQIGFRAFNWWAYGKFVGVDFKEANFQRAMRALNSVRSGGTKPYVAMTRATMKHVYEVSPAFASLAPDLDGGQRDWESVSCEFYASSCGEISSGWFMWALRSSVDNAGYYVSPSKASAFFGKLADEVEAACERGALECVPQPIAEMPPMTWTRLADGLRRNFGDAFGMLFVFDLPGLAESGVFWRATPNRSNGDKQLLSRALRFLNYPLHRKSQNSFLQYTIHTAAGWYYRSGSEWVSIAVNEKDGSAVVARLDRGGSPDIAEHYGDDLAMLQRYYLEADCESDCVLQITTPEGETVTKSFGELAEKAPFAFAVGKGTFYVDRAAPVVDTVYPPTVADARAAAILKAIFATYRYIFLPVLVLGVLAFAVLSVAWCKNSLLNVCYVMALVCWILLLSRVGLLLLAEATALPGLLIHYMAPAYFMLVCGAVFSCAAWPQLRHWQGSIEGDAH
jgi:hypothetical protein